MTYEICHLKTAKFLFFVKYSIFIGQGRLHTDIVNACLQQLLLFGTTAWDNPQILNVTLAIP